VLLAGEVAISSDKNGKQKVGNGTEKWSELSYAKADLTKSDVTNALGYTPPTTNTTYSDVTQSVHGLMTAADKVKLDGIASGANKTTVDSTLSSTSENPVQNKVINSALAGKSNTNHTHDLSTMINTLSTGTSTPIDNDYYISQYSGGGTTTTTYHRRPMKALFDYIKGKLSTVAVSGSYNDLSNKPTIPSVGNGTITIKQAGTSKGTFTMNQSGNTTIELTDNNTTYSTGTASTPGLTKLYTGTGIATDGTMTQAAIKTALDGKANSSHSHDNSSITSLDASKLTGKIDIARLPEGALERCVIVADDTARFKLTTASIQKGDTVKVTGTGKMYFVIDDTKLSSEDGYTVYTAGSATSVPWTGITGKPSTFAPSSHNHNIESLTNFSSRVFDATVSRTANTVLAAPNGSNGIASFRKLVAADLPSHTHDDRYYTESEIDTKLSGKSDTSHTHDKIVNGNYGASVSSDGYVLPVGNSWIGKQGTPWNTAYITNVHGTADNATTAKNVTSNGIGSADVARHVWFSDNATETLRVHNDNFKYNPSTQMLTTNISGNAATATKATSASSADAVTWEHVTGKPTSFTPASHNHDSAYLKLSGGTVTGVTSFTNTTASTSKTTGAVKLSGGLGVAGRVSANEIMVGDGCTLKYDSTNKCIDFVFA
ncbi:MAG TPA: hypothetical protein DCW90_04640, partial [Lachnospiraceae bacterium]|nr:hypothetical protein [Lachnospiraceae bacterium]